MEFFFFALNLVSSESVVVWFLLTRVSLLSFMTSSRTKTAITCLSSWCVLLPVFFSLSLASLFSLSSMNGGDQFLWGDCVCASVDLVCVVPVVVRTSASLSSLFSSEGEEDDTTHFLWRSNDGARSISRSRVADENTIHVKTQRQNSSSETPALGNPASSFASRTTRTKSRTSAPSGWTLKSELWNWKGKR